MMESTQPIHFAPAHAAPDADELARADLYGLLASLFYRAPDATLLHRIAASRATGEAAGTVLGRAWNALCDAAAETSEAEAADEYQRLFIGVGRQEIFLYGSYYLAGFLNERPLVALRDDLARYGLARQEAVAETEDHIAALCEVMRFLVAGDDAGVSNLAQQQAFFSHHLQPWVERLCEALAGHPQARFYRCAGGLLAAFAQVEGVALSMA